VGDEIVNVNGRRLRGVDPVEARYLLRSAPTETDIVIARDSPRPAGGVANWPTGWASPPSPPASSPSPPTSSPSPPTARLRRQAGDQARLLRPSTRFCGDYSDLTTLRQGLDDDDDDVVGLVAEATVRFRVRSYTLWTIQTHSSWLSVSLLHWYWMPINWLHSIFVVRLPTESKRL